jgi:hypothetical protein
MSRNTENLRYLNVRKLGQDKKSPDKEHAILNGMKKEFQLKEMVKMKKSHDMKWISKTKSKKRVDTIYQVLVMNTKSKSFR